MSYTPNINDFNRKTHDRRSVSFIRSHYLAFKSSLKKIFQKPFYNLITILLVAAILTLPATLYLLIDNYQVMTSNFSTQPSFPVFLKKGVSAEQVSMVIKELRLAQGLSNVTYISPKQGLNELKAFSANSNIAALLANNPLPGIINITLSARNYDLNALHSLLNLMKTSFIIDQSQLDVSWLQRIGFILAFLKRITFALTLLLCAAAILAFSHATRLVRKAQQGNPQALQFLGTETTYIHRPFLYYGFISGSLSGLIAWALTSVIFFWITSPLHFLIKTYSPHPQIHYNATLSLTLLVGVSAVLGLIGAWVSKKQQVSDPYTGNHLSSLRHSANLDLNRHHN